MDDRGYSPRRTGEMAAIVTAPSRGSQFALRIFSLRAKPRPPKQVRRFRAADLPEVIAAYPHQEWLPWGTLAKEREWWPADRKWMIAEPPVSDSPDVLCRIAVAVHALCDRDCVEIPDWVWQHQSRVPIALSRLLPTTGFLWEWAVCDAPPACAYHNVWFGAASLTENTKLSVRLERFNQRRANRGTGTEGNLEAKPGD